MKPLTIALLGHVPVAVVLLIAGCVPAADPQLKADVAFWKNTAERALAVAERLDAKCK